MAMKPGIRALLRGMAGRLLAAALAVGAVTGPARAIELIDSSGGSIYLEVNKGRLLRLDEVPSTVFLANPDIADLQFRSTRLVYLFGKTTGETSLFALDKKDQILLNRKIIVGYDLDQIAASFEQLLPNSGIKVSMVNTTLVLDGNVGSPAEAEQVRELAKSFTGGGAILNRIKVSMPNQVNLRVVIAEVSRSVGKEFGIDFDIVSGKGSFGTFVAPTFTDHTLLGTITNTVGKASLGATLIAMETEGLLTVLAEPNLTTLSGETASFLAGGEFPFSSGVDESGNPIIEFKEFGVSLSFTPTILDDSRISLKVRPEVSQISETAGLDIPTISTRRAETTVELGNGQSMTLAGLLQRDVNQDISKVPGLGDIPILGALFRSSDYRSQETELVIVVTPYIVKPTNGRIALPTDGFQPPNDYERIVWGTMYRDSTGSLPTRTGAVRGQKLVGKVGFHLE